MKKLCLLSTLVLTVLSGKICTAQDFSNKGKDFWVAYGYHQVMAAGNGQEMVLYFATESVTTVTVSIPGLGYTQTYSNIPANTVFTSNPIPKLGAQDARLVTELGRPEDKGIHVTADKPIVAYAHIYNASVSGATILFPTATLGKEYYSINYTNISNTNNAHSWFYVVACDTGTTTVEITPSAATLTSPANTAFTVDLTQGQVYNVMGALTSSTNPFTGVDLTGSKIRSISTGTGSCKRIGVFSGSGRISITCTGASSSSDNYMVQAFPKAAWGKKYLTAPTGGSAPNNIFRVCVSNPLTVVTVNGAPIGVPLIGGFYYELPATSAPMRIEANEPIIVAQYLTSQGQCGNGSPGDPETIYLSPVEQNINKVLWNATGNFAISQHFFNVIIPNTGTAISSFKLDGVTVPASSFITHPQAPGFSYYTGSVFGGQHTISSDSGFNAIAYGYGSAESYGYNAGTNIKDIYQYISIENQYATVNFPATCKNTPFYFSMTFPYQPTQIQWIFNGLFPNVTVNSPVPYATIVVNGRTLYQYRLPTPYTIATPGTYPIKVIAQNPTPDGCGGEQEIDFDLQVFDAPLADFNFTTNGCVTSPVQFTDNSTTGGRPVVNWHWNFGDATFGGTNNPSHTYTAPGAYTVKYAIRTDVGCLSDTVSKVVNLSASPIANFGYQAPLCAGKPVTFSDTSTVTGGQTLVKWTWNFGDGSPVVNATTNADQIHVYTNPGTYTVTLVVETNSGCASTVFSRQVTISTTPVAAFALPNICLPSGTAQFTDQSTISSGSITGWAWNFGDGNTSTLQNPVHNYSGIGPYTATLVVTSNTGCTDDSIRQVTNIFAQPHADFTVDSLESCMGGTVNFTDASTAPASTVTQWFWDFGDATTSNLQNPAKQYAVPGTYTVKLYINSAAGCRSDTMVKNITVLQLPTVSFTNSTPLCEAGNILFTSTSVPNAGIFTQYSWTVNSTATGGNNPTMNYTPASAGTYTVQLTALTDKGCSNSSTASITVNAKPVANFTLPNVCLPAGTANFTSTSTISSGSITGYAWNFGDGNTSTQQNPTNTYTGTGPYTVSLTVTSNSGCTDTKSQSLTTIYAEPQPAFNAPAEVCHGTVVNFTDVSTAAGSTVAQWSWNFGDGNTSTLQNPTHTYAAPGTYTVTLRVTSAAGCQTVNNVATKTVVVNALPAADFTISAPGCATRSISFTDISVANSGTVSQWTWNFGDGNTSTQQNPLHPYSTPGTYNVTLQVQNSKGCVSTVTTKPVTINVLPKAGFITPEACINDVGAQFTDTSSVNPGSITGWSWNFGDANANAGNPNTSTVQNPTHHYTAPGSYTTTLVAISDKGCTDTVSQTFFVNGSVPVANFTVQGGSNSICSNQSLTIKDGSTVDVGSLIKVEVYWDYTNDPTIKLTDTDPVPGETYTHTYPEFGTPASKTITIRYVAYSGTTCLSSFNQTITLMATPTLQFTAVPPVCEDAASFQVTQAQMTNGLPGTGVFTGNGISAGGLFNPGAAGTGQHTITYTYTGTNGCSNSISNTIEVNPKPGINAGPDKVVLEGGSVTLTPSLNASDPVTYLWTPSTWLNNPTVSNPVSSPLDDIMYTVTVTSDKGCIASDQVFVKLLKAPVIPNVFTPNRDGRNDTWVIEYLDTYPGCIVEVFNRYGQIIFRSVGYSRPWDGTYNGKEVPAGTYYYIVDPKNGRQRMAGFVDIVR